MRIFIVALLLLVYPVNGAIIHGTVYSWENLEPLAKAIVTINTTPEQRVVTENGTYSFVVPPGTYVIKAYYYSHGELELYDEENITVKENGTYVLDLILFPPLTNLSEEEIPKIQVSIDKEEQSKIFPFGLVVLAILVVCVVALFFVYRRRGETKEIAESRDIEIEEFPEIEDSPKRKAEELPEDLKKVIEIIKKEGGRITQKELRKKLGYSEAKVSLMIADLERRGLVEKVKKGRGNIIFLKE